MRQAAMKPPSAQAPSSVLRFWRPYLLRLYGGAGSLGAVRPLSGANRNRGARNNFKSYQTRIFVTKPLFIGVGLATQRPGDIGARRMNGGVRRNLSPFLTCSSAISGLVYP
ncbi:protein of unknown function (plasmid) [Pararobbsia alpina]